MYKEGQYDEVEQLKSRPPSRVKSKKKVKRGKKLTLSGVTVPSNNKSISRPNRIYRVLSKMTYGFSDADKDHILSLPGANNHDKIMAYIDEQLEPDSINDEAADTIFADNNYDTLSKSRQELFQQHSHIPGNGSIAWNVRLRPSVHTIYATYIRAIHSKKQLLAMMTDFWHNHFSVYMRNLDVQPMFSRYDQVVIKSNALGNFRTMLQRVTRSTCMLAYLGNGTNNKSAPNENYARELLELYTISAKNFYPDLDWQDVPTDSQGRRLGYTEDDIQELARALTGWSYSGAVHSDYQYTNNSDAPTGRFMFRASWHDEGVKKIMGQDFAFDSSNPQKDVNDILDMLAEHPATAQFLATKLCRRFIADVPTQNIIDLVADSLHQNWQNPDQIKLAMEVLLKSPEFLTTWGEKVKRPFEKVISAMRQVDYPFTFPLDHPDTSKHRWEFRDSGHYPFHWTTPDGYPDVKSHWLGSSTTMETWKFLQWVFDNHGHRRVVSITTDAIPDPNNHTPNKITDFWYRKICGIAPDSQTLDSLAEFLSYQDYRNPFRGDLDAPIDLTAVSFPSYVNSRLGTMVNIICLTTSFSYR